MLRGSGLIVSVFILTCAVLTSGGTAAAKTLEVGSAHEFKVPSAAIAAATSGDTIRIDPGEYFDCAVVNASRLIIEGTGPGVILTDKTCQGKAILVTVGSDITIRNLTLQRARVPDQNGAGIRMEGKNLTVENSRFLNNENGILTIGELPESALRIIGSEFIGNGKCNGACAHGIYAGHIALVHIERSKFFETHRGHHVKSRAIRTELIGNQITDGEQGNSSYLVDIPNGGSLVMKENVLEKGPNCENHGTAISIGAEGVTQRTEEITIDHNTFTNDQPRETTFVRNQTATPANLVGNTLKGFKTIALAGDGTVH